MKFLLPILTMMCLASYGQQSECVESWSKFDLFKTPVDYRFKVFNNSPITTAQAELTLDFIPNEQTKYDLLISGIRLYLTNWSDSTIRQKLSYMDLVLVCQVQNGNGSWLNIENPIPESFCSNGIEYFDLTLNKGDYLKLKAPCYKGPTKVTMRYQLTLKDIKVYSNEVQGYINPEQLE